MPYQGTETLVFRSNTGETDTIFFLSRDTMWKYPNPYFGNKRYEIVQIICNHTSPTSLQQGYLKDEFVALGKRKKSAELKISLAAKDAWYYRLRGIKLDSLKKIQPVNFKTQYGEYNDVYVFDDDDWMGNFHLRSNYITKLYWSKSHGVIRYDKKYVYWELEKKLLQ